MTIEIQSLPSSTSAFESDDSLSENEENMSPLNNGESFMVALKPNFEIQRTSVNAKMMVSTPVKHLLINNDEMMITENIPSPVKRSSDNMQGAPLAKKVSATCSSLSSNSSTRLMSVSASAVKLKPAFDKIKTNLSQSCFADIRTQKFETDADLTCLNWLQEGNLLNGFNPGSSKKPDSEENNSKNGDEHSDLELNSSDPLNYASDSEKAIRKPAYSFSALIFMAIESTEDKCMPVKDIYQWIQDTFPYFQKAPIGWKNSVRHNLSLNKSFKKVEKKRCIGKGSLWTIDHEARAGLVQQLRKTTAYNSYPYSKISYAQNIFSREKNTYKRDSSGRFLPNHDDKEFDVAATMCSLSSPTIAKHYEQKVRQSGKLDHAVNLNLLKIWRTYLEPYEDGNDTKLSPAIRNKSEKMLHSATYSIGNFIDEVKKLSFNDVSQLNKHINNNYDEDYEFDDSDESDSEDDEMSENMKRLVDRERDDTLGDSGYSEEGTFKSAAILDHSYSKSVNHLTNINNKIHQNKAVDALLYLANAATQELEKISSKSQKLNQSSPS